MTPNPKTIMKTHSPTQQPHGRAVGLAALLGIAAIAMQLNAPAATLVHRYSFSESSGSTLADSVGGTAWNGAFCSGSDTNAVDGLFDGSQLYFVASSSNFVALPPGILENYPAVTIEAWASFGSLPSPNIS